MESILVRADASLLSKWYVKVPVILFFIAWAVISWYGIYKIRYGQPLSDLAPDGSYLQDYDRVSTVSVKTVLPCHEGFMCMF